MSNVTREEFAAAVTAAVSSVHHLYREVDRLFIGLRDALADGVDPFAPVPGTIQKSGKDPGRLIVRNEYGALFRPAVADEGGDDEEEDDDEDDGQDDDASGEDGAGEDDNDGRKRRRKPAQIAVGDMLLAIRIALYDPREPEGFEPHIEYAVMTDWAIGSGIKAQVDQPFVLAWHMLRRIPRAIGSGRRVGKEGRLVTRATVKRFPGVKKGVDRHLTCKVHGLKTLPLFPLQSAEELDRLVQEIRGAWREVAGKPSRPCNRGERAGRRSGLPARRAPGNCV